MGGDADHRRVTAMLGHLVEIQRILSTHATKPVLPVPVADVFKRRVNDFLQSYSLLANAAEREKVLLFSTVVKHHWLSHLGDRAAYINPRKSCCLLDESFVGKIKQLVRASAHGTPTHRIPLKVAELYRYGFFVTLRYGHVDLGEEEEEEEAEP